MYDACMLGQQSMTTHIHTYIHSYTLALILQWGNYQIGEHSSDVIDIKFSASHTYGDTPRKPGGSQLLSSSGKRTASIKPMNRGISTSSDNRGVNQSNSYAHHTRTHSGTTRSAVVGIATLVKYSVNRERVYSDSEIPHSRCAKVCCLYDV